MNSSCKVTRAANKLDSHHREFEQHRLAESRNYMDEVEPPAILVIPRRDNSDSAWSGEGAPKLGEPIPVTENQRDEDEDSLPCESMNNDMLLVIPKSEAFEE